MSQGQAPRSPEQLPSSSLIICSRNRPGLLRDTVASILKSHELPTEVVIIDQSDEKHPELRDGIPFGGCEIRYIWADSVGLSRARNDGIAAARHAILVFTDDDVITPPTWFGTIVRALAAAEPGSVITGQVLPCTAETPGGFVPSIIVDPAPQVYEGRVWEDVLFPLNMAMHRSTVTEIGLFDDRLGIGARFPAAEDNDFGFRLLESGYRIRYVPEAALYHRAWRNDPIRLRWRYGRGQGGYFAKHWSLRDTYIPRRMFRLSKRLVRRAVSRAWPPRLFADLAFLAGMLSGAVEWRLTQRRRS